MPRFGFKGVNDEARLSLLTSNIRYEIHRAAWTDVVTAIDVFMPHDTKFIVEEDKSIYYYLAAGKCYFKTSEQYPNDRYKRYPPDTLFLVERERQEEIRNRIEAYYQTRPQREF